MNNSQKGKKYTNQSSDSKSLRTDPPCAEGYVQDCSSGVCKCVEDESADPPQITQPPHLPPFLRAENFGNKKIRDNK